MRTLEQLKKQYNSSSKHAPGKGGPGFGPRGRGMGMKGKPKNTKKTIGRLLSYVSNYKYRLIVVFICMMCTTVFSLVGGYMMAPIITKLTFTTGIMDGKELDSLEKLADDAVNSLINSSFMQGIFRSLNFTGKNQNITEYIFTALAILAVVYICSAACSYIQAKLMMSVSQGSVQRIRNDLFTKLQSLPIKYFDQNPTGEVMSRFTNDIDNIDMMLNNSLTSLVGGFVSIIGTFVFMVSTNIWLTLITICFIPVFLLSGGAIGKKSSKYYSGQQAAIGAVNGYVEEHVTGQKVVKVFNHEDTVIEEFNMLNEDLRNKQVSAQFWGGIMGPILGNASQICYSITLGVGGILLATNPTFTVGKLTVFAGYSKQFSMPINQISMQIATIFAALAGAERVFNVMDSEPEAPDEEGAIEDKINGHVVLNNVTFGYNPDKTVLKNISLYAKPGQKIAFVGSTGAGKTTITNLLNRFYDISEGEITIDGKPLISYNREYLRKNIAMVLQDTHLFTGTVMENIRYGRLDATDDEVISAAKTASAHSFIMRLENGYDTVLEGDGANLSQGQRQLLNIARAALSKAPILVLDEATSSVDTRTERHIERGMDRLMEDRTTFVIAHRLSTVRNSNAIMVLEKGEIIERGTHDDLLEMKGRYYELYTGLKELD